jgi:hypothetical protein
MSAQGPGAACWCGCGQTIPPGRRSTARYVDSVHKRARERAKDIETPGRGRGQGRAATPRRTAANRPLRIVVSINDEEITVKPPEPPAIDAPPADTSVTCTRGELTCRRDANGNFLIHNVTEQIGLDTEQVKWLLTAALPLMVPR